MPGATATEFRDVAGYAPRKESPMTMSAGNLVDAALAGVDAGELVTILGLHDEAALTQWEADRRAPTPRFANAAPAPRYRVPVGADTAERLWSPPCPTCNST